MKTRTLAAVAAAIVVVPALVSFGCNKKEDLAPAPSATQAPAPPPPPAAAPVQPTAAAPAAAPQHVVAKVAVGDAGAKDGATVVVALPDAAAIAIPGLPLVPNLPTIHPSALPAIASGVVGGIIGALPSGLIPPPPAPSK
jgi:hypothetical protein